MEKQRGGTAEGRASKYSCRLNTCGVWVMYRWGRYGVSTISRSLTTLMVSFTGTPSVAPPNTDAS